MLIHGGDGEKIRACKCLMKCSENVGWGHERLKRFVGTFYKKQKREKAQGKEPLSQEDMKIVKAAWNALSRYGFKRDSVWSIFLHDYLYEL